MNSRLPLVAGALLATTLALASCTAAPAEEPQAGPTSTAPTPQQTQATQPAEQPQPEPSGELTCESLISEGTVEALTSQGWTAKEQEFRVGETLVEDGLMCMWADYTTASDHGQIYAWGPMDAATADTAKSGLQRDGWIRSTEGDVTYFTEDPAYAIAVDDDGYGMTYAFGDGWVEFADTKQGLLLIEWTG